MSQHSGVESIAAERARQIEVEGWTPAHDDEHDMGQLSGAASTYLQHAFSQVNENIPPPIVDGPGEWPWPTEWWKPSPDPVRNLEKAGALIAAEIDRLKRKRVSQ